MSRPTSTIELNGKRYDTRTGALVDGSDEVVAPREPATESPVQAAEKSQTFTSHGQNLDGFVRRHKDVPQQSKTKPQHLKRPVQKSQTLMRPAVSKPVIPKSDISRVRQPKLNPVVNHARINRAENTSRSPHVSKFGGKTSQITKKEAHLPVVEPTLAAVSKGVTNELNRLENALKDANSHLHELEAGAIKKIPFLQRVGFKNKFANIAAMSAAFLLLVGFFGYQNYAQVSIKVASAKSGVEASLPSYKPTGYGMDKNIQYQPGVVAINFNSRTDDKGFTLKQQASSWSSASLLANYVNKENCENCYQTWQSNGKTIYIYNDSNATWVDGGVWYMVEGNAQLTSDQLLRLASSL